MKLTEKQLVILDRLIDGKTIKNRKDALDALFALADTQLRASGF